jgi:hypothetical protein
MENKEQIVSELMDRLEALLAKMQADQVARTVQLAGRIIPGLTHEDILNPDNFPKLMADKSFIYEDGIAAGLLSAKIAVRAEIFDFFKNSSS